MSAAVSMPGTNHLTCAGCGVLVTEAPWKLCPNATHWREHCGALTVERDKAVKDRQVLLSVIRWMSTATAFMRGGSLRKEWCLRVKRHLERAKREGWA